MDDDIARLLGDPENRRILASLRHKQMIGHIIMMLSGVPKTSFYRKLKELVEHKLVIETKNKVSIKRGMKHGYYTNNFVSMHMKLGENGKFVMQYELKVNDRI